jgi:hypothetical protein
VNQSALRATNGHLIATPKEPTMIAEIFLSRLRTQVGLSEQKARRERSPRFVPIKLLSR